ncbi:19928_t:CDS:2 [Funneliformis geosporum]|uniref:19928_t:CDS:1 n=1 Tax=Funneliformis geosporum TaxID=1117311 RepID=A0A9W4SYX9_9GLOM|nr:19928_t:CDS:2 [Funneliformis geosporum]
MKCKKLGEIYRYEVRTFVDSKHGKALIDQIKTVDKKRLIKKLGQLTEKEMDAIQEKLLGIFDLWEYLKKRELTGGINQAKEKYFTRQKRKKECYPYIYKGSNNTYLCGNNACGGNVCFKCGKIETRTEWRKEEDCCGNEIMREKKVEMFYQTEKDENDPDRELKVYYCEEHQGEAQKKEQEREEKLNNQKNLFYSLAQEDLNKTKQHYFVFLGKENGQKYYLMVPQEHSI